LGAGAVLVLFGGCIAPINGLSVNDKAGISAKYSMDNLLNFDDVDCLLLTPFCYNGQPI